MDVAGAVKPSATVQECAQPRRVFASVRRKRPKTARWPGHNHPAVGCRPAPRAMPYYDSKYNNIACTLATGTSRGYSQRQCDTRAQACSRKGLDEVVKTVSRALRIGAMAEAPGVRVSSLAEFPAAKVINSGKLSARGFNLFNVGVTVRRRGLGSAIDSGLRLQGCRRLSLGSWSLERSKHVV